VLENESTPNTTLTDSAQTTNFWHSPTLEELANAQGVSPIADGKVFFGTWPGEPDDGFERLIDELRHPDGPRS